MKKVTATLQGGLGNQLFIFFAGLFLAEKIGAKLVIDSSLIEKKSARFMRFSDEMDISFGDQKVEIDHETRTIFRLPEFIKRIIFRVVAHRKLLRGLSSQFRSKVFGYDSQFELVSKGSQIYGYFQTHKYLDILVAKKGNLTFIQSKPSALFEYKKSEIQSNQFSIGIHYRRGDYTRTANLTTIGLLADKYFTNAIEQIENYSLKTFYIFSDSPDQAETFFSKLNLENIEFIRTSDGFSPIESLLLMSYCRTIIISNSTYSWWSAYLGREGSRVIAPEPWFRNLESPKHLLMPGWTKIKSVWQD